MSHSDLTKARDAARAAQWEQAKAYTNIAIADALTTIASHVQKYGFR